MVDVGWCRTCGNPVSGGQCVCWCLLADALQQYLGLDHDGSAQMAADLWQADADKPRVWSAEYARDHFYGETHQRGEPIRVYPGPVPEYHVKARAMLAMVGDDMQAGLVPETAETWDALGGQADGYLTRAGLTISDYDLIEASIAELERLLRTECDCPVNRGLQPEHSASCLCAPQ
jgi:hypothetical protein